jgi:hypothetical protein
MGILRREGSGGEQERRDSDLDGLHDDRSSAGKWGVSTVSEEPVWKGLALSGNRVNRRIQPVGTVLLGYTSTQETIT